jgi:hypothetical protein
MARVARLLLDSEPLWFNEIQRRLDCRADMLGRVLPAMVDLNLVSREPLGKWVFYNPEKEKIRNWLLSAWPRMDLNTRRSEGRRLKRRLDKLGLTEAPLQKKFPAVFYPQLREMERAGVLETGPRD